MAGLSDAKKKTCFDGFHVFTIFQNKMMVRITINNDAYNCMENDQKKLLQPQQKSSLLFKII